MSQETSTPQETPQETPQMILSNILHANSVNIPENDYLKAQNVLMQLNKEDEEEQNNNNDSTESIMNFLWEVFGEILDASNYLLAEKALDQLSDQTRNKKIRKTLMQLLCMSDVTSDRIRFAFNFILVRVKIINYECKPPAVNIFQCESCEDKLSDHEIKNKLIPLLQSIGFDIYFIDRMTISYSNPRPRLYYKRLQHKFIHIAWRSVNYNEMENLSQFDTELCSRILDGEKFLKTKEQYYNGEKISNLVIAKFE